MKIVDFLESTVAITHVNAAIKSISNLGFIGYHKTHTI